MQYTQNIGNKLLNAGLTFDYNHTDDEISYDVYRFPHLEITVDHTNKKVVADMLWDEESILLNDFNHLEKVIEIIKSVLPKNEN